MELKQLQYFVHVADASSFSKAAQQLNVDQSVLSRNVRRLEVELRQSLLTRHGRGVVLTEAGRHWLSHCRGIFYQLERAKEELERRRGAAVGRVVVGLTPSIAVWLTERLVRRFKEIYSEAAIGVVEGLSGMLLEGLNTGRIDIGLVHNPKANEDVDIRWTVETPLYLISAGEPRWKAPREGKPVTLAEVVQHELIMAGRPNALRTQIDTVMAEAGLRAKAVLEVEGISAILNLVGSGHGGTVLPFGAEASRGAGRALSYRQIVKPRLTTKLALVVSTRRPTTGLLRTQPD